MVKRTHQFLDDSEFEAAVKQLYEDGTAQYAEWWSSPHIQHVEAWERFTSAVKPGGSVLDVGCNSGTDLRRMVEAGYRVTGIDVSESALSFCRENCPEARTITMNMLDLRELGEQFDGVWVAYSLLHIPFRRIHDALDALAAVLKPDGVLLLMGSVTEESIEHLHSSNVMFDAKGNARGVPAAHWKPEPLIAAFASHFDICWQLCPPYKDGWAPLSLLVRPLASDGAKTEADRI